MGRVYTILLILPLFIILLPLVTAASDLGLEKGLQSSFEQSKAILERAKKNSDRGIRLLLKLRG